MGFVPEQRLGDFYASLDVFTLPSVNDFEAWGIVQAVAMLAGVAAAHQAFSTAGVLDAYEALLDKAAAGRS